MIYANWKSILYQSISIATILVIKDVDKTSSVDLPLLDYSQLNGLTLVLLIYHVISIECYIAMKAILLQDLLCHNTGGV